MTTRTRQHKFAHEQRVEVQDDNYPPVVEVVALLPAVCKEHGAPKYGCVHGGDHFSFCEDVLKPLSPTNRSKLN
jgi:hypothetical protein